MHGVTHSDRVTFVDHLEASDLEGAVRQTMDLFETGVSVGSLVTGLLAPAQREAGAKWQAGDWAIAQVHAATTVVDNCLSALGTTEPLRVRAPNDFVVVAVVEGEGHACAARMVAESLRSLGWRVKFLGAAMSADRVRAIVEDGPRAVLLSSSMTSSLPGAARCIDALVDAGVPVIVGGAAFGRDATRATRLGASGWAENGCDAAALLDGPLIAAHARARAPIYERLDIERVELACEVCDSVLLACPDLAACTEVELRDIRTSAEHMVGALVAGALLSEDDVFADYVAWMDKTMRVQPGYHPSATEMLDALAVVLERRVPVPTGAFDAARARLLSWDDASDTSHLYDMRRPVIRGRTPMEKHEPSGRSTNRLDEAAEAIRARAHMASERARAATPAGAATTEPLARLREQAERLLHGAPPVEARRSGSALPADDGGTETPGNARAAQVVEAARAQAARLIDEAEHDAAKIRTNARDDAARIVAAAQASAADVLDHAEAEALEWLADAGRQVVGHLDEVEAEGGRILATARADAARITADASRVHAEMTAAAAEAVQQAQKEAERQVAQAESSASAIVAKAHSEAAAITAAAQAERTALAEEAERLATGASALLEVRLNEVEAARAEAAELRAAVDASIEADTRRLLGEAQADCDRILVEAQAEADRILERARAAASGALDLRTETTPTADAASDAAIEPEAKEPVRRRRFRP